MPSFYKEPGERLDYSYEWVLAPGDAITSSVWAATPVGLTLSDESFGASTDPTDDPNTWLTLVWLMGGTDGTDYELTNTITTLAGRTDVQRTTVRVGKEIVPAAALLASLPGGDDFDLQQAREIVDAWVGRLAAVSGGPFPDEAYARSVVRKGAQREIFGEILRQSGHLGVDEITAEEERSRQLLKEYDDAKALPAERGQYITTWPVRRG